MERRLLLGNEAIARGCVEAGVSVATTYPGTPSSEIGHVLDEISGESGLYFEYSTNEKVAVETAAAAAACGLRSFVFMKHVGVNVASDPLISLGYVSVRGGMVVLSADDPSMHSSQNEQDNRHYARLANLPMLEPSTPAEAKDMTVAAFDLSERLQCPVFLRTTTRVNHARGVVPIGVRTKPKRKGHFERDAGRFVPIPAFARQMRLRQLERNKIAAELSEGCRFNFIEGEGKIGVVASGVAYTYAKEFLADRAILKLGMTNPLPERRIADFVQDKERVIVLEELDPLLEDEVLRIAGQIGIELEVVGKRSGHLPMAFEYSPDTLLALAGKVGLEKRKKGLVAPSIILPPRPPVLCAGCPHRATFYAVRKALGGRDAVVSSDIGCYSLGISPPMNMADFLLCMGSSVGAAGGFAEATDQKVLAFIGDSTFFHAGVPGLINAVFNDHRYLLVVMDNRTTAMTGHQPNPGTGRGGSRSTAPIDIEPIIRSCGVKHVRTVDPYDIRKTTAAVKKGLESNELSVVIARRACPLAMMKKGEKVKRVCAVDPDKCTLCKTCVAKFACPAMSVKGDKAYIEGTICTGCGACVQICPKGAIGVRS
ncbi:MAG: indolepyruvate ferredoxin oxidoreductase subunit alpha [Methanomassiliicoccales archaeon]|nr:indolepyruvate ferredoxin oxidoreductase subunit alpha [Methanomassiliicoccales archaeon]